MPYCPRCGVETDPSVRACPLCTTTIPPLADLGPGEPAWPTATQSSSDPSKSYATTTQRRMRAAKVLAAVMATAALAVLASDFLTSAGFTWSRYPLISLTYAYFLVLAVLVRHRNPAVWGAAWFALTASLLAALDLADGQFTWSVTLGLPITALSFSLIFLAAWSFRRTNRKGWNLVGLIPLLSAVELIGIDALVGTWTVGQPVLSWSLVTSLVLLPLAFLFFFLHLALRPTPNLRRIFHF